MHFIFVLEVRALVQDLVSPRPAIATFQPFADVVVISFYTPYETFVDDTELKFLELILEGEGGGGLCDDGGGFLALVATSFSRTAFLLVTELDILSM